MSCAESGVLSPLFPGMPVIERHYGVGCRIIVPMPIVLTKPNEGRVGLPAKFASDRRFGAFDWSSVHGAAEDILFVMRLAGRGRVFSSGSLLLSQSFFGHASNWILKPTNSLARSDYVIDKSVADKISMLWSALCSCGSKHSLPSICVRRFNSAMERQNLDDAIVDITIAAEALFLRDSDTEREELGFRLRVRAAKLLALNGHLYSRTLKVFSKAYSLRSKIVHGGHMPDRVSLDGESLTPEQFLLIVTDLMREALSMAAERYTSDKTFATSDYWERLLFGAA